jgi:DNA-binding MurR/RpiR family transcriptional regulator
MTRFTPARRLTYDKVLLAVYILADKDGVATRATCGEVATQAGVSTSTAWKYLNELHVDEVINIRGTGRHGFRRIFLLLDHPKARELRDSMRRLVASEQLQSQES